MNWFLKKHKWINTVKVLSIKDEDAIVIRCEDCLSDTKVSGIIAAVKSQFPNNNVLVLDGGLEIEVLRKENS